MQSSIEDLIESATPVYEQMRSKQLMSSRPRMSAGRTAEDCCMSQVKLDWPAVLFIWLIVLSVNAAGLFGVYAAAQWAWHRI